MVGLTLKNDFIINRLVALDKKLDLNKNPTGYGTFSKIMNDALDLYFKEKANLEKQYLISELDALKFVKEKLDQQHEDKVERFKRIICDLKILEDLQKSSTNKKKVKKKK